MKKCSTCKIEKTLDDFYKSTLKGHQTYCKVCANSRRSQWAKDNKDKVKTYQMKYTYKLSAKEYSNLLKNQDGRCGLCTVSFNKEDSIVIDHDHSCCPGAKSCGKCVRGILHQKCNLMLGFFEDSNLLSLAYEYLDRTSKPPKH